MQRVWMAMALVGIPVAFVSAGRAPAPGPAAESRVERGKYLVTSVGCGDCHTPKKMGANGPEEDHSLMLSGHPEGSNFPVPPKMGDGPWIAAASWDLTAWAGPWGVSYAMNLTPDENTGIGSWSEETFVQALRTGRHMGVSRPILPPMPWWAFRNFNDEDLKSIYAFLRTVPPVSNRVPLPREPEMVRASAK